MEFYDRLPCLALRVCVGLPKINHGPIKLPEVVAVVSCEETQATTTDTKTATKIANYFDY